MTPFDLFQAPLSGVRLIEAGAGTGKTYSIEGLYLRLILEAGLPVEQILVLTFTVAATEELRRRIRERLSALRDALAGNPTQDPMTTRIAAQSQNPDGLRAVEGALLDFDRAAIYTIHGFCQRLLTDHAFETGSLFDTELVVDPAPLIQETASDFWRRHLYDAAPELVAYFFEKGMNGPGSLAALYTRLKRPGDLCISGGFPAPPALTLLDDFRRGLETLRSMWPQARQAAAGALMSPSLKVRPYGSLEATASGAHPSPREVKVAALCRAMDRLLDSQGPGFPLFDEFDKWTARGLSNAARKGTAPPEHPFFRACDEVAGVASGLGQEMDRRLLWLKTEFVSIAAERLADHKRRKNILFYDDLLLRTRDALRSNRGLLEAAKSRYRAALVDEFQDTDAVQYEIFERIFRNENGTMFMIGDPKQAIYGFRGADVFTYLSAARNVDTRYSLDTNRRSKPGLVHAVNALFSGTSRPFLLRGIEFVPARSADAGDRKEGEGVLEIWPVSGRKDGRPLSKSEATALVVRRVAAKIEALLCAGRSAGQIAVLVRTNRQARDMKAALSGRRIPAVLHSAGSVFESEEAIQLERLLAGICDSGNAGRLRAAMTTDMIGVTAAELECGESDPDQWALRAAPFAEDARIWREQGFIRMFQSLMKRERCRRRLLGYPDGERRLTNVLHLAELCHRAETESDLAPGGLLKWLAGRRASASGAEAEEQLRLENDARAVQVVTVHRSKGLEFPVVFVPFAWEASAVRSPSELMFHDPEAGNRLTLDLGGGNREKSERLARTEALAEDLRLLYVAVTRAKERCYLAWGRINQAEMSPVTYLLHGRLAADAPDPAAEMTRRVKAMAEADFLAPLAQLVEKGQGSIATVPFDADAPLPAATRKPEGGRIRLAARRFSGRIDQSWRVASYSQLVAGRTSPESAEAPDRDRPAPGADAPESISTKESDHADILAFPGGTRAGNFFHELLEISPFSPDAAEQRQRQVADALRRYRYDDAWQEAVGSGLERVLSTPLSDADPDLVLSSVPQKSRLHELAFYFPLKRIDGRGLAALLPQAPGGRMQFSAVQGYVKGYIDLAFYHGGRYFLVDWKSNRIGPRPSDYGREALERVMHEAQYVLQYTLYCLALDLFLRQRDPDYRFETGFGGVFYLFIRGMRPEKGPELGVYYDRPDAAALEKVRSALLQAP